MTHLSTRTLRYEWYPDSYPRPLLGDTLLRGYAFIEYENFEEAQRAINEKDGSEFLTQIIHVDWAFSRGPFKRRNARRRLPLHLKSNILLTLGNYVKPSPSSMQKPFSLLSHHSFLDTSITSFGPPCFFPRRGFCSSEIDWYLPLCGDIQSMPAALHFHTGLSEMLRFFVIRSEYSALSSEIDLTSLRVEWR
ncbi:putative dynein light chain 1, cytoplasmic-like [Capsicum annuum]|nr:putative dynein light chain 1, cytoplasmic-like [Capsicum annuum]